MKSLRPLVNSQTLEQNLRLASYLRDLCLSLPRILTPWEKKVWPKFEAFAAGEGEPLSTAALVRCCEIAWKWKRFDLIIAATARCPQEQIDSDRDLSTYYQAARLFVERDRKEKMDI